MEEMDGTPVIAGKGLLRNLTLRLCVENFSLQVHHCALIRDFDRTFLPNLCRIEDTHLVLIASYVFGKSQGVRSTLWRAEKQDVEI